MNNESVIPTPATPDVCTVAILIDGTEISGEFQIFSVYVSRELNRIPSATIHLQDGEAAKATFKASNTEHFIPGKKIEIQLGYRSSNDSVFKGVIVKHSIKIRKTGSCLILECKDIAVKMTGAANSRYFIDKKDSDIMEEIIVGHGLQKQVAGTQAALKEVLQYDATDWDFLLCRAEANGLLVTVEDGKVIVAAPVTAGQAALKIQYGATLLELDAEIDARWQSKGIQAQSWNAGDQDLLKADANEPATTGNGNINAGKLAEVLGGAAHTIRHGGKLTQPELQTWADARLLKERLGKVRGRAKFQGFAGVMPGKLIEIIGIGDRFAGKLYVSGIRHSFSGGQWETDVQLGLNPELVVDTLQLRPMPAAGLLPAVSGLQIGVVTALENDPDGEDRIKVRLPMVSSSAEGSWARLLTLDAGKQRGTFFRPEIGDEVIVGFLNEDPRFPVVLGMCHSSAKPAPEPGKDNNHKKGYVSREKMKLTFDDEKKIITLETPGGNKLTLSDEDKGISLQDQNGNKLTLNDSGIQIESSKDLILKAAKTVKMEGTSVDIAAQSAFKATGTGSAEVSGASTTIKGSATTVIQGGLVQIN